MRNSSDKIKPTHKARSGITYEVQSACGNVYVTCNNFSVTGSGEETKLLKEVFIRLGKAGGCAMALCESLGKMISIYLQEGGSIENVIKHLNGVSCHQAGSAPSCVSAVATIIKEHIDNNELPKV